MADDHEEHLRLHMEVFGKHYSMAMASTCRSAGHPYRLWNRVREFDLLRNHFAIARSRLFDEGLQRGYRNTTVIYG